MVVVLNVAEKPSVARALQTVFGRMPGAQNRGMQRDGSTQIFTHDGVQFPSIQQQGNGGVGIPVAPHTMITTSVRGHLASQDFNSNLYGWQKCEPVALFDAPIETFYRDDMQPLQRMLTRLAKQVQYVILWLDCDREGEAIGDEVRKVCLQANPARLLPQHIFRAKFSTVLAPEIERALQNLGRVQEPLVDAVQLRSELDLRVGAAFTRFQTLRLQYKFEITNGGLNHPGNGNSSSSVLSYGPCQFPTLGFVVERWARIQTFVPQQFWSIDLCLICGDGPETAAHNSNNNGTANNTRLQSNNNSSNNNSNQRNSNARPIQFTWKRVRLYDQIFATALYESCLEAGPAVVVSMQGRPQNKWRPVPLATVELQKRASRYLRIGSEQLMAAAEELYQQGYISYPRTETERFRPEFQHQPLLQQFASLGNNNGEGGDGGGVEISAYAHKLLNEGKFQMPRAGQHDDQAHPPITPCKAVSPHTIADANQRRVYTLVVKHYLACCSRDAVGRETTLTVRLGNQEDGSHEEFSAKGLMILEHNWLEIYQPWERWSTGQGELPHVQVGSRIMPHSLVLKEGSTSPPSPLSEVELISLMDRNGIGTDATIATHIATIQDRDYAIKDGNQKFSPTPLGIALIQGYNTMGYQLNKPDLRREMEAECNHVAAGRKAKQQVLVPLLSKMKQTFQTAVAEAHKLDAAMAQHFARVGTNHETWQVVQNQFSRCGQCQTLMTLKQQANNGARGGGNNNNNRRKVLLFCSTCNVGWPLPRSGIPHPHTTANSPTICPLCQFQVVHMQRGEGYEGNGYALCPKCFSNPPVEFGGAAGGQQFKCFECQNTACPLSSAIVGGETPVFACPFCSNNNDNRLTNNQEQAAAQVSLKRNSRGFVLSCNRYQSDRGRRCPYTIWLPKQCQTVSVVGTDNNNDENYQPNPNGSVADAVVCNQCSSTHGDVVRLISIQWKPGSVPPHYGRETTVCVVCDSEFRQEFHINLPQPGQVVPTRPNTTTAAANNRGRGAANNGRGGGGGRAAGRGNGRGGRGVQNANAAGGGGGIVCYACGEPGHFANTCPNR
ncbi:hypothetical protein ACA910_000398 [Epithemia clementina (nom. ined.)]